MRPTPETIRDVRNRFAAAAWSPTDRALCAARPAGSPPNRQGADSRQWEVADRGFEGADQSRRKCASGLADAHGDTSSVGDQLLQL